jgi:LPPG:FO 2-phospho-L-lactate transferase
VLEVAAAEAILIAPSNLMSRSARSSPSRIRDALEARRVRSVAVSPLIGGQAVKGPADRMLSRMAGGTTPAHVAQSYTGLIDALVIDRADAPADAPVELVVASTRMHDRDAARRLADVVLEAACA